MTGTSKALARLGVASLGAVVAFAGFVPLALSANAVAPPTATSVTLDKHTDTAAVGTCNAFTATVTPAGAQITVNITQAVPANQAANGFVIGFCNPVTGSPGESNPTTTTAAPGSAGADTNAGASAPSNAQCGNKNVTGATPTASDTVSCNTTYTDANADGKITFGVTSSAPGSMSVTAFGDTNGNGAQDVSPSAEPGDHATKTWVANSTTSNTSKITCSPPSASNPTNTTHTFKCQVTDANGVALSGQDVNFGVTSGPDAGVSYTNITPGGAASANATSTPAVLSNATCSTTDTGVGGTTPGQATCSYNNNGQPGHDVIQAWIETNQVRQLQAGEPAAAPITKDWIQAAAIGSLVSVTCSPNQTNTYGGTPSLAPHTNNLSGFCQVPLSQTTVTFTASVVNGTPAAPQSGVLVQWSEDFDNPGIGEPASTTDETLSATTCTTDASGKCSVTLTNAKPFPEEDIGYLATVGTQGGTTTTADGEAYWHNPKPDESRNVTLTPGTATQPSGGVQSLTAMVTDRFPNPVAGVVVYFSETGPGAFRNGSNTASCTTDATGKCSVDVSSLTTESGDQTVTATIDKTNYTTPGAPTASGAAPAAGDECNAPAGYSNWDGFGNKSPTPGGSPNVAGQNNKFTGAPAGTCSATAKVTWQTGQQNGSLQITSFTNNNPAACSAFTVSGTAPSGSTVTLTGFNFRQGTFTIGTATAAANGAWTFSGSGICFNTTVTASTGSGSGATNSNTVTLGFHQVFTNVHFTRVGPYRRGLIEYNVSGSSTSIVGGEPIRVQNSACRSGLCGITHMRSSGFDRLHIYLLPGTYSFVLYGTGGSDAQFGGDGHQYLNAGRTTFTVTIH